MHQLFLGGFEVHRQNKTIDQIGHLGAYEMRAEKLAGLLVEDSLEHALVVAKRDGLSIGNER